MADGVDRPGASRTLSDSDMLDVTAIPVADLVTRKDSALDHAVRRVLDDLEFPGDIISGWNSFIR
jgi:FXSXX-COOH protein